MRWTLEYYKTASGQDVVKKFIETLHPMAQAKLGRQLELLEEFESEVGMPHAKMLGEGLMELRVRGGRGTQEARVFYVYVMTKKIFLLHGFVKKSQATPKSEIDIARNRKREIESR